MYRINLQIRIIQKNRTLRLDSVTDLRTRKSINSFVDEAMIRLPLSARLERKGEIIAPSVQTANEFEPGDQVEILLGHDDNLRREFAGFISKINYTDPVEIECEGYSYHLKRTKTYHKSWRNAQLLEVLKATMPLDKISLHPDTTDMSLDSLELKGYHAADVLRLLKDQKGLTAYFVNSNQLYVGLKYLALREETVKHRIGRNTLKDESLKYRRPEDNKIWYSVSYRDAKGKTYYESFGDPDGQHVSYDLGLKSKGLEGAKEEALRKAAKMHYVGYEGYLSTLLEPYCQPGWKTVIGDEQYPERNGEFVVESVETRLGPGGDLRIVGLGPTVSYLKEQKV